MDRPPPRFRPTPRLTAVLGVTRAMLTTLGPEAAVGVLISEFGWDTTFQALALIRSADATRAFGLTWEMLLLAPLERELGTAV